MQLLHFSSIFSSPFPLNKSVQLPSFYTSKGFPPHHVLWTPKKHPEHQKSVLGLHSWSFLSSLYIYWLPFSFLQYLSWLSAAPLSWTANCTIPYCWGPQSSPDYCAAQGNLAYKEGNKTKQWAVPREGSTASASPVGAGLCGDSSAGWVSSWNCRYQAESTKTSTQSSY